MISNIQRRFILGDEWAYFKIYSGPKTIENILINEINAIVEELLLKKVIDKFFFIRFSDPNYHIRLRFHLIDKSKLYIIILLLNRSLKYYIDERLIQNFLTDTYNREIERYGSNSIALVESLFYYDSLAIIRYLNETPKQNADINRWKWGVKCIDLLLEKFSFNLVDKTKFYNMLSDSFSNEFNMNKLLRKQLNKKYNSQLLISEEIFSELSNGKIEHTNLGDVNVKGREKPITIIKLA